MPQIGNATHTTSLNLISKPGQVAGALTVPFQLWMCGLRSGYLVDIIATTHDRVLLQFSNFD